MSRAKRRTRNTSRKRVTPRLDDTVGTLDESRSAAGPGNAAPGENGGERTAAVRAAHRQEGERRLRRGVSARTPRTPAEPGVPAEPAVPAASGVPAEPAVPAASGVPAEPAVPAASGVPAEPAVPAASGVPAEPAV
ncbi:hypothetical protein AB0C83_31545, partial [Streptomyces sp. NPDC048663]